MTHRERVLKALSHNEPDRCPWDLWATPEVMERLREYVAKTGTAPVPSPSEGCRALTQETGDEAVFRHFDVDLRSFYGPSHAGQAAKTLPGGIVEDLWGVKREVVTVEGAGYRWTYKHLVESPLAGATSVADVENYRGWPDPAAWDFASVAGMCRRFHGDVAHPPSSVSSSAYVAQPPSAGASSSKQPQPSQARAPVLHKQQEQQDYAVVNMGDRLDRTAQLKPAMYLRGVEQILADLIENEALADAIFERIYRYFMSYNRRVFEAATVSANSAASPVNPKSKSQNPKLCLIDVFMMGDDFGTQHGAMVSPAMWRRFFKKRFRDYIDLAHAFSIKVMHHTCGSVRPLIGEFIDCGLDILQSVQPQAEGMDLAELKREFGKDIAFHGSVDIQGALPHGTPADVRREVKQRMAAGKPGGGFIISTAHNILPDTPTENIVALFEAYREFGAY
jgi:uroporphyrinogen decarboxylase